MINKHTWGLKTHPAVPPTHLSCGIGDDRLPVVIDAFLSVNTLMSLSLTESKIIHLRR